MKPIILHLLALCLISVLSGCSRNGKIEFIRYEDQIDVMINDKLITSYLFGHHLSKPVLHPVKSPSGESVTRGYPFDIIEGESNDHAHQTGVFFTYGSDGEVNGTSFWYNPHDRPPFTRDVKLPQIRHIGFEEISEGRNSGRLVTLNHWMDIDNKPLLEEQRVMEFSVQENEYKIDFTFRLTATDTKVTFRDTKEGLFAIRVADWLAENTRGTLYKSTGEYLDSHGERTEKNIWARRSSWMRLEGEKDNKKQGVVIFNHPGSFNYPAYWHARGYGCFSANPLGQFDFQTGTGHPNPQHLSLELKPGESALFRFRMIIYEGTRNKIQLDEEFEKFSRIPN